MSKETTNPTYLRSSTFQRFAEEQKDVNKKYIQYAVGAFFALACVTLLNFGFTLWSVELSKESHVTGSTLVTTDGSSVVATGNALVPMSVNDVLKSEKSLTEKMDHLQSMDAVRLPSPSGAVQLHKCLAGVELLQDSSKATFVTCAGDKIIFTQEGGLSVEPKGATDIFGNENAVGGKRQLLQISAFPQMSGGGGLFGPTANAPSLPCPGGIVWKKVSDPSVKNYKGPINPTQPGLGLQFCTWKYHSSVVDATIYHQENFDLTTAADKFGCAQAEAFTCGDVLVVCPKDPCV